MRPQICNPEYLLYPSLHAAWLDITEVYRIGNHCQAQDASNHINKNYTDEVADTCLSHFSPLLGDMIYPIRHSKIKFLDFDRSLQRVRNEKHEGKDGQRGRERVSEKG